ncbi:tetratricopeptide repeat protein [Acinetobacter sichuanensis]|uniref:tetratricopeptide repeat protein n=1 Tax=Acinetobacter sichuanensis TaxID=2136183 RepID=UPI00280D2E4A|nr:tetratricopeptide repeat protein [Acinetobacter sichuanensis]MDQ9020882.1 tetratricopeptide repeat protein [Acinetobacter sichuanensis]
MKKILLSALLSFSCATVFAAPQQAPIDPKFAKVEQLIEKKDFNAAYKELENLSKTGDAQALYNLAFLTQAGKGTTKDDKKAISYYQQSSDKGYSVASYALAKAYQTGELGVKQDLVKARQYLEKSSQQGFADATVEYAVLLFSEDKAASDKLALQKLDPLIKSGNLQAIHAKALYDMTQGFKSKRIELVQQGVKSIQGLAQKGYLPALLALANMMVKGEIIEQNLPEAKRIYEALAKQNIPNAKEAIESINKMMVEQAKKPAAKK